MTLVGYSRLSVPQAGTFIVAPFTVPSGTIPQQGGIVISTKRSAWRDLSPSDEHLLSLVEQYIPSFRPAVRRHEVATPRDLSPSDEHLLSLDKYYIPSLHAA
jgi:hypothetical protein